MLSALAVSGYILPLPTLTFDEVRGRTRTRETVLARLAKLSQAQAQVRAWLSEQSRQFDELYRQAAEHAPSPDDLEDLAEAMLAKEREAADVIVPQLEQLRQRLARPAPVPGSPLTRSLRRASEESIDIGASWLEQYQNLRIRLLKLASDRRRATDQGSPVFSDAESATAYLRALITE